MAMTLVVTRNVADRFRGFLASCMCEVAPGVYVGPRMTRGVRERVWNVLEGWFPRGADASIVMTWPDTSAPCGQAIWVLGVPRTEVADVDGLLLTRRELTPNQQADLGLAEPLAENRRRNTEEDDVPF